MRRPQHRAGERNLRRKKKGKYIHMSTTIHTRAPPHLVGFRDRLAAPQRHRGGVPLGRRRRRPQTHACRGPRLSPSQSVVTSSLRRRRPQTRARAEAVALPKRCDVIREVPPLGAGQTAPEATNQNGKETKKGNHEQHKSEKEIRKRSKAHGWRKADRS